MGVAILAAVEIEDGVSLRLFGMRRARCGRVRDSMSKLS